MSGCKFHMREGGLLDRVRVVRADSQAGVEFAVEVQLDGRSHLVQRLAVRAQEKRDRVAALFKPQPLGRADVEGNVLRGVALVAPVLQRRLSGAVNRCVRVERVCIERLPEHQQRLAMRARSRTGLSQLHVGRQRHVAGNFLPDEMECVDVDPEICAGRAKGIDARCGIESRGTRRHDAADVGLALEDAERSGGRLRECEACSDKPNRQRACCRSS